MRTYCHGQKPSWFLTARVQGTASVDISLDVRGCVQQPVERQSLVPLWKKILLRSLGFGAGFALLLCAVVGTWVWYRNRPEPPKPWNKQAITAEYELLSTRGDENHVVFVYALQNNTDEDFRLDSDVGINLTARLQEQKELAQFSQTYFSLEYPVFVPARNRVRLFIESKYKYPIKEEEGATKEDRKQYRNALAKLVIDKWSNLNGFAVFDTIHRYEIDFPTGWEKVEKEASADKK
jgi:hypothetical protein